MKSNNALIVILGTVTLDAVGIGLVMPVLPGLLRDIKKEIYHAGNNKLQWFWV